MNKESLYNYLEKNIKDGIIDFSIRASICKEGDIEFYIRPTNYSGETNDYYLAQDPENEELDLLLNKNLVPEPNIERFMEFLGQRNQQSKGVK